MAQGLDKPQTRAEYTAAPDPTGERAKTLKRLQAAYNIYKRIGKQGRTRLQKALEEQQQPGSTSKATAAPRTKRLPAREQPWLALLSDVERAHYDGARADALRYKALGLHSPQRRTSYLAATPDPRGVRARAVERMRAAYNMFSKLDARARTRLRKQLLQQQQLAAGVTPQLPRAEPPWLAMLSDSERDEYYAARDDALDYQKRGLTFPERRAEYLAEADPTGERAQTLERLQAAYHTYKKLSSRGRQRLKKEAAERSSASVPEDAPRAGDGSATTGERE
jgi:hypothetical protein